MQPLSDSANLKGENIMKKLVHYIPLPGLFLLLTLIFTACGSKEQTDTVSLDCPFTEMSWESTVDDVIALEGDDHTTYDSVYGGTCYTYPKEHEGLTGTVKYMFDDKNRLMCVAWACGFDNTEELQNLYDSISADVNGRFGESSYNADNPGNFGNVWYLDSGDIVLSTMITSENKALQYAYLHPLVSNKEPKQEN